MIKNFNIHNDSFISFILNFPDRETFILEYSKQLNITFSHISSITKICYEKNIIDIRKDGRRKYLLLTEKGKKIQACLMVYKNLCEANTDEIKQYFRDTGENKTNRGRKK